MWFRPETDHSAPVAAKLAMKPGGSGLQMSELRPEPIRRARCSVMLGRHREPVMDQPEVHLSDDWESDARRLLDDLDRPRIWPWLITAVAALCGVMALLTVSIWAAFGAYVITLVAVVRAVPAAGVLIGHHLRSRTR
jgi:hypothetical protein